MADDIYREIILDHYKNPRNKGVLDPHDYSYEDVKEIAFSGRGCAVSQASASILTEMVEGKSLDEVKAITKDDLLDEIGIPVSPARLKCALLGLKVLKSGIYGVPQEFDEP